VRGVVPAPALGLSYKVSAWSAWGILILSKASEFPFHSCGQQRRSLVDRRGSYFSELGRRGLVTSGLTGQRSSGLEATSRANYPGALWRVVRGSMPGCLNPAMPVLACAYLEGGLGDDVLLTSAPKTVMPSRRAIVQPECRACASSRDVITSLEQLKRRGARRRANAPK
jgi:hypothetical protein